MLHLVAVEGVAEVEVEVGVGEVEEEVAVAAVERKNKFERNLTKKISDEINIKHYSGNSFSLVCN